jgi:phage-related protein
MRAATRPDLDYLGFSFGGTHSLDDLNIYRTISDRFNDELTPEKKDLAAEVPGRHGSYYFGSFDKTRKFNVNFAFDGLTEMQIQKWRRFSNNPDIQDLIFDETPYKVYSAKITGKPILKYVPFEIDGQRIYKGEGTLEFTCYYPYAHTPNENTKRIIWEVVKGSADTAYVDGKTLSDYNERIFPTKHLWAAASGLPE